MMSHLEQAGALLRRGRCALLRFRRNVIPQICGLITLFCCGARLGRVHYTFQHMMENKHERLKESWRITKQHFEAARALLPSSLIEYPESEQGSLKGFEEYLAYNELELALDELEGLGDANHCSAEFWQELAAAAENMELAKRADCYRGKADQK